MARLETVSGHSERADCVSISPKVNLIASFWQLCSFPSSISADGVVILGEWQAISPVSQADSCPHQQPAYALQHFRSHQLVIWLDSFQHN